MRRPSGSLVALALAVTAFAALAVKASAAPPTNDTFAGARTASIGFGEVIDTTEATTDGDDAQLNATCHAPATDASVWYALQGTDTEVFVNVQASNYTAGVLVGVGSQGNLTTVTCFPGGVFFFAAAGTTYYVLAVDDQFDGGGNGGSLSIAFNRQPLICNGKVATIVGTGGNSTVSGTSGPDVIVDLTGNNKIRAAGGDDTICTGPGNDAINGGGGNDWVDAGDGTNSAEGNAGHDTIMTGSGNDELEGNGGNDTMTGGAGGDKFRGGDGTDTATDFRPAEGDTKTSVEVLL